MVSRKKHWSALTLIALGLVTSAVGCGADGGEASGDVGGAGGDPSSGVGAGPSGVGGADASSSTDASSGSGTIDGEPGDEHLLGCAPGTDPELDGIDMAGVELGAPPETCAGGFDVETGVLAVTLDADAGTLLVASQGGLVTMNGAACTVAAGGALAWSDVARLEIAGSDGDDRVIVDLTGWAPGPHVWMDLAAGTDDVFFLGTSGDDRVGAAPSEGEAGLDWTGDGAADAALSNIEGLTVSLGAGDDVFEGAGADGKTALGTSVSVCGGPGADVLQGGERDDLLAGGAGDDRLVASMMYDGDDVLVGGDGFDVVDYGLRAAALEISLDGAANDGEKGEADRIKSDVEGAIGGTGDDRLVGSENDDWLDGGPGADWLEGLGGRDTLNGGDGDDQLDGGDQPDEGDVLNGGGGLDVVTYAARTGAVSVTTCSYNGKDGCPAPTCACPADDGEAGEGDTFVNVEGAVGGSGNDTMVGSAAPNWFFGGPGDDTLMGGGGDDMLFGDEGMDDLVGGDGQDYLDGGPSLDLFDAGAGDGDICVVEVGELAVGCELY
jgi:Ca2+-binding RTX toxin-like protein